MSPALVPPSTSVVRSFIGKQPSATIIMLYKSLASVTLLLLAVVAQRGVKRNIKITNDSGSRIVIYWVHPSTRDTALMSDAEGIPPGADFPLDSYVGHEFEVREMPLKSTGSCATEQCRITHFAVSENDEQVASINKEFEVVFVDNKIKATMQATDLIKTCKESATEKLASDPETAVSDMMKCVESGVATALEQVNEEIAFQASIRKEIAATLENYTCVDDGLNSTEDVSTDTWIDPVDNSRYMVHVKFDRAASRIHTIEKFIKPDECAAMEEAAKPSLHDATVADVRSRIVLNAGSSQTANHKVHRAREARVSVTTAKPNRQGLRYRGISQTIRFLVFLDASTTTPIRYSISILMNMVKKI